MTTPPAFLPPLAPVPAAATEPEPPRWPAWMPFAALVAGVAVTSVLSAILLAAAGVDKVDDAPPGILDVATILQDVVIVGASVLFAAQVLRPRPWHFGLRPTPALKALGVVAGAYIGFALLSYVYASALNLHDHEDVAKLGAKGSSLALAGSAVVIAFVAPVCEELFFRGFMFGTLRRPLGVVPAALITGTLFGLVHLGTAPVGFIVPLGAFGVLLCAIYQYTGSLWPAICLHALNNAISLGVTLHWSWQIPLTAAGSAALLALLAAGVRRLNGELPPVPFRA